MRLFSNSEEVQLNTLCNAMRWDYLASTEFKVRNEAVFKLVEKHLPRESGLRVLEIGGNPAPFIGSILDVTHDARGISVEPYISPIASSVFQKLEKQGLKILPSLESLSEGQFDIIVFLGIDLSLAKDYLSLTKDAEIIKNLMLNANIIITETSNYEPSKWLEDHFTAGLQKLESQTIKVDADSKYSISSDIQIREISIWRNTSLGDNKVVNDSKIELIRYAEWHAIQGTPKIDPSLRPVGNSGYDVQRLLQSWQVETPGAELSFSWLKKSQKVTFPKKFRNLTINYVHGPKPINQRHFFYSLEAEDDKIVIRRKLWRRTIRFHLDTWIPSKLHPESSDHRNLTIAASGYEFT